MKINKLISIIQKDVVERLRKQFGVGNFKSYMNKKSIQNQVYCSAQLIKNHLKHQNVKFELI